MADASLVAITKAVTKAMRRCFNNVCALVFKTAAAATAADDNSKSIKQEVKNFLASKHTFFTAV